MIEANGLLIALVVFLAVQGLMLDLSFLVVMAFVLVGYAIHARQVRRERRTEELQAVRMAEALVRGRPK